ncbi:MAG: ribbon-helix-helix protein, CopG family [Thermoprotei archaeon]|nr:ribbon-helix-helix protein, CopG family [Thermoprotei archaeon]
MGSVGIYLRVDKRLLERFSKVAELLGMNRSEAIRRAMEMFITVNEKESMTSRMRGLVKSKLTLRELEEIYWVSK